jgi:hypothetical protein
MMIAVVKTLDPREDRRGLKPLELDTRLTAGVDHLKISAHRTNGSTIFNARGNLKVCDISMFRSRDMATCQTDRQLKIPPVARNVP